jgi:hypothetical protein
MVLGIKNPTPWLLKIVGSSHKKIEKNDPKKIKSNWANRIFFKARGMVKV